MLIFRILIESAGRPAAVVTMRSPRKPRTDGLSIPRIVVQSSVRSPVVVGPRASGESEHLANLSLAVLAPGTGAKRTCMARIHCPNCPRSFEQPTDQGCCPYCGYHVEDSPEGGRDKTQPTGEVSPEDCPAGGRRSAFERASARGMMKHLPRAILGVLILASLLLIVWSGPLTRGVFHSGRLADKLASDWGLMASIRGLWEGRRRGLSYPVAAELAGISAFELLVIAVAICSFFVGNRPPAEDLMAGDLDLAPEVIGKGLRTARNVWFFAMPLWTVIGYFRFEGSLDGTFYGLKRGSESGAVWGLIWGVILAVLHLITRGCGRRKNRSVG